MARSRRSLEERYKEAARSYEKAQAEADKKKKKADDLKAQIAEKRMARVNAIVGKLIGKTDIGALGEDEFEKLLDGISINDSASAEPVQRKVEEKKNAPSAKPASDKGTEAESAPAAKTETASASSSADKVKPHISSLAAKVLAATPEEKTSKKDPAELAAQMYGSRY